MGLKVLIEILLHVLQGTIKNPKSIATELNDLVAVRDELNNLITAIDPSQVPAVVPALTESEKITVSSLTDTIAALQAERTTLVNQNNEQAKEIADLKAAQPKA